MHTGKMYCSLAQGSNLNFYVLSSQPRSQGLLRFQDGGAPRHLESGVDPGNEVAISSSFARRDCGIETSQHGG